MNKKNIYLTDKQYLKILSTIENKIKNNSNLNLNIQDNTCIGNKFTTSNIGFCNEEFTTLDTALFPEQFKKYNRRSMKYRKDNHACPFDNRVRNPYKKHGLMSLGCGCYYTCMLRENNKLSNKQFIQIVKNTGEKFKSGQIDKINEILISG